MAAGVLFCTHYGGDIGNGHIMRCLSIASTLQSRGLNSVFLLDKQDENTALKLNEYKCYFVNKAIYGGNIVSNGKSDEQEIIRCMKEHELKIIFIDKYSVTDELLHNLKTKGYFIMGFDDFGLGNPSYGLLIDHNYICDNQCKDSRILGGLEYCVIDERFKKLNDLRGPTTPKEIKSHKLNLFVNLGSGPISDYERIVLKALKMEGMHGKFNVFWLGGSKEQDLGFSHYPKNYIKKFLYINNMAKFMTDMDLAIGSCGVNAIERCVMGIPSLVFRTAENQERNYQHLIDKELITPVLNEYEIVDRLDEFFKNPKMLKKASDRCRLNIDGKGVYRVVEKIESIVSRSNV